MKYSVLMPELGEGVIEGELQKWCVAPGDQIQEDDIVAEVMTDKASLEVPSTASGHVKELKFKVGQVCPVGATLLVVEGEKKVSKNPQSSETNSSVEVFDSSVENQKDTSLSQKTNAETEDHVLATPLVRKVAQENSINLSEIKGTGLSGRITLKDFENRISKKTEVSTTYVSTVSGFSVPSIGSEERKPLQGVRKKIAQKMQASKNVIPHFTLMESAVVEELVQLRRQAKELYPDIKITYLSFIMKILYNSLLEFPELNASIDDYSEEIVYKKYFHFGFATDTPKGLLVPVIHDVDKKNIVQISREIKALSDKARAGSITVDEMKGATITITNMGSIAGQWATPIINPPEVCILGMYRMSEKPVWQKDQFYPVKTMNFSLTSDHRLIDGAVAARFMSQFIERVENPSLILIEN